MGDVADSGGKAAISASGTSGSNDEAGAGGDDQRGGGTSGGGGGSSTTCGLPGAACCSSGDQCVAGAACADGLCACVSMRAACGGKCVDTMSDTLNCGACAHSCLGGACTLGTCEAVQIEKDQGRLFTVSVDAQYVYWGGDNAAIAKKSLDGTGMTTVLVPYGSEEDSYDSVLAGNELFWGNDWHDLGVRGCVLPACSGGPKTLISGASNLNSMAYDPKSNTLFWDQSDGIWHQALPAGTPSNFVPLTSKHVTNMTTDGTFLYWTEYETVTKPLSLKKTPVGSLSVTTLALDLPGVNGIAVRGSTLYFIQATSNTTTGVRSVPLPNGVGSGVPAAFAPEDSISIGITADTSGVYWTTRGGPADAIKTCALTGCVGAPKILSPAVNAWGITTDMTAVYWVEETGRVMKVAK